MTHLKQLGTLELGTLGAQIVEDAEGRKCIALMIGDREICFTITQAMLIRQMLDAGIQTMLKYTPAEPNAWGE